MRSVIAIWSGCLLGSILAAGAAWNAGSLAAGTAHGLMLPWSFGDPAMALANLAPYCILAAVLHRWLRLAQVPSLKTRRRWAAARLGAAGVLILSTVATHFSVAREAFDAQYAPGEQFNVIALIAAPMFSVPVSACCFGLGWVIGGLWSSSEDDSQPLCSRCGYSLRGLMGSACPECGVLMSDGEAVGMHNTDVSQ